MEDMRGIPIAIIKCIIYKKKFMQILVTGGAGYIGSVVCEKLAEQEHTLTWLHLPMYQIQ